MKRIIFYILAFVCAVSCNSEAQSVLTFLTKPEASPPYVKVYIIGCPCQSNGTGQASTSGLDAQYLGPLNAKIYSTYGSGTNVRTLASQSWQPYEINKNNNNEGVNGIAAQNVMGPDVAFAKKMSDAFPDKIRIIKYCKIGSAQLGQGGLSDWKIGAGGTLYNDAVQNTLINGLNEIIAEGFIPDIRGYITAQGESERVQISGYSSAANQQGGYTLQFSRTVSWLIDDLVEAGFDTKNMRIAVMRIHNSFPPGSTDAAYLAAIRAAHADLGTNLGGTILPGYDRYIAGVTYIDTDAYGRNADDVHFNQAGQISFGTDLYNYFSPYVNEVVTVPSPSTSGFDTDAISAIAAMGISSQTQANALNTLVASLKSNSLWTPALAIYSLVGGNRHAHRVNIKDPSNVSGYALTFNTSTKHTAAGFDGYIDGGYSSSNAGAGWANTHIPMTALGQNTAGFFYHTPTNIQEAAYGMGVNASGNSSRLYLPARWTDNNAYGADMGGESTVVSNSDGSGTFGLTRTSSSNYNAFTRGTKTAVSSTSATPDANTFYIGARNVNTTIGSFSIKTWDFFIFFNASLNDTQAGNLKTIIETFETAVR